jgi:HK97 family phage prohead protease
MSDHDSPPRRDDLIRAVMPGVELRASGDGADSPVLFGHFARFNEWAEIRTVFEGHFMERFAPGAFKKTFREQRDRMRVLFQHGMDPEVGDKPIAAITELREDDDGAYYEASLFDGLPNLVMDGLRANQYGASMRFGVMREHENKRPEPSEHNPDGLPERTVIEARVPEFGPVTFPAYAGATAGVRSLTDDFIQRCFEQDPDRLRAMFEQAHPLDDPEDEVVEDAPAEESARREQEPIRPTPRPVLTSTRAGTYTLDSKECSWRLP